MSHGPVTFTQPKHMLLCTVIKIYHKEVLFSEFSEFVSILKNRSSNFRGFTVLEIHQIRYVPCFVFIKSHQIFPF